ncbi:MAG TPA: hypothetical protein VMT80_00405, partial [Candidatus Paceibacterota bacterium]|nr:hypothetical protein [Candidatus Paceibacterota bacterium]
MKLRHTMLVSLLALAAPSLARAADAPKAEKKADAMPPMPTLPPEGKRWVEGFLGSWKSSDTTMKMGDQDMKGTMTMKCAKTSGGWGASCTGDSKMGKDMSMTLSGLVGWDIGAGEAHWFEVTSVADTHNHVGKWTDDKT